MTDVLVDEVYPSAWLDLCIMAVLQYKRYKS